MTPIIIAIIDQPSCMPQLAIFSKDKSVLSLNTCNLHITQIVKEYRIHTYIDRLNNSDMFYYRKKIDEKQNYFKVNFI